MYKMSILMVKQNWPQTQDWLFKLAVNWAFMIIHVCTNSNTLSHTLIGVKLPGVVTLYTSRSFGAKVKWSRVKQYMVDFSPTFDLFMCKVSFSFTRDSWWIMLISFGAQALSWMTDHLKVSNLISIRILRFV